MKFTIAAFCIITFLILQSCSKNDNPANVTPATAGGIYQILTSTLNVTNCTVEGVSQLDANSNTHYGLFTYSFFGTSVTQMMACTGAADCQDKASKTVNMELGIGAVDFSYTFDGGNASTGYTGTTVNTGFTMGGSECTDPSLEDITLKSAGADTLLFEGRKKLGDAYPPEGGYCTTQLATAASTGKPCSEYTVIRAFKVGDLSL